MVSGGTLFANYSPFSPSWSFRRKKDPSSCLTPCVFVLLVLRLWAFVSGHLIRAKYWWGRGDRLVYVALPGDVWLICRSFRVVFQRWKERDLLCFGRMVCSVRFGRGRSERSAVPGDLGVLYCLDLLGELGVLGRLVGFGDLGVFICWVGVVMLLMMGWLSIFLACVFGSLCR